MKTRDIVRALLDEDPGEDGMGGDQEVCVDNVDIQWVDTEAAYYDGCLQVLERNPNTKYYNVIGAKYMQEGSKIVIHPLSINDAIFCNHNIPVDLSNLDEHRQARYATSVELRRQQCRKIEHDSEFKLFTRHILSRLEDDGELKRNYSEVQSMTLEFFDTHYQRNSPFPNELRDRTKYSHAAARNLQWLMEVDVVLSCGSVVLKKVEA